ncbi:MAG TPA: ATP-dependent DNA helicase [Candidatus Nanopelagicaceae bacterium]|nr:ATP-dependent DNA helicase [Candidatus Nanopelagicaceae bacterium]
MSAVELLLAALTPAQREVVEQRGRGPVKVAAAAGSGKTKTMATLYALGVAEGVHPARILAVTFTDRAAVELRERILATMADVGLAAPGAPDSPLEGAWIGTFHQLARRLIAEQPYLAEVPRDLALVDEVEAQGLLREAADSVRGQVAAGHGPARWIPENPDLRALLGLIEGASAAVTRLRSTDLDPSTCRLLSQAAYGRFEAAGDPSDELAWHRCAMEVTIAIWEEMERRLVSLRALDFDGLLRQALAALTESPALTSWCQANFRLIIVDEYQDTSAVQSALLERLAGARQRELFVVGDARQSIFAFRDAKPGIMAETAGREYSLFRNHRSVAPILAAADHVIRADVHFASDQPMEVGRGEALAQPVLLGLAESVEAEADGIAQALLLLRQRGIPGPSGSHQAVEFGDMAVLAYTFNRLGPALEEAFRRHRIPFQTATGGLLIRPEIKDALALLRLIADAADDQAWVRVLQSPWVRVSDSDLLQLVGDGEATRATLEERLRSALGGDPVDSAVGRRVQRLVGVADELRSWARIRPAAEVLSAALDESGLLAYHEARSLAGDPDGHRALSSLRDLQRVALNTQAAGSWLGLDRLLERIAAISDASGRAEPPPRGSQQLVTLSTIHRAKGLEWPVVVLADCRPHHQRGRPPVLWDRLDGAVVMSRIGDHETAAGVRWKGSPAAAVAREEHRRLVYVAMTRARDLLLVTTTRPGVKDPAPTLEEVIGQLWHGSAPRSEYAELASELAAGAPWIAALSGFPGAVDLPWGAGPAQPSSEAGGSYAAAASLPPEPLERRWEELRKLARSAHGARFDAPEQLSFSSIRTMASCPRQFWFQHLANFLVPGHEGGPDEAGADDLDPVRPGSRSGALDLGRVVHSVLEQAHRLQPDRGPHQAQLVAMLEPHRRALGAELADAAESMLSAYAGSPIAALPTVAVELAFSWRAWAGDHLPPLVGAIDRVARLASGELLVIDYKTNMGIGPSELGEYQHQLRLYAAALGAGLLGEPSPAQAVLLMLRSGGRLEVDCNQPAIDGSLAWARRLAEATESGAALSGLGHPDRPCHECDFREFCPERRPGVGGGALPAKR